MKSTGTYLYFSVGVTLAGLLWMTTGASTWRRHGPVVFACALSAIALHYHAAQPFSRGLLGALRGERITLVSSRGLDRASLWIEAADVELYSHVVELVRRETRPHETILAIPRNPELYYLTRRRNPFRFYNIAIGVRNADDLRSVLAALEREPPKLVFHRPDDNWNTPFSLEIMAFVKRRYELLETREGALIRLEIYRYPSGLAR